MYGSTGHHASPRLGGAIANTPMKSAMSAMTSTSRLFGLLSRPSPHFLLLAWINLLCLLYFVKKSSNAGPHIVQHEFTTSALHSPSSPHAMDHLGTGDVTFAAEAEDGAGSTRGLKQKWWNGFHRPMSSDIHQLWSSKKGSQHSHVKDGKGGRSRKYGVAGTVPAHPSMSCEVCVTHPEDPLCVYGIDNVRLSRMYQGSGHRVRKVLEKALRGEKISIGILGASVSVGRGSKSSVVRRDVD